MGRQKKLNLLVNIPNETVNVNYRLFFCCCPLDMTTDGKEIIIIDGLDQ